VIPSYPSYLKNGSERVIKVDVDGAPATRDIAGSKFDAQDFSTDRPAGWRSPMPCPAAAAAFVGNPVQDWNFTNWSARIRGTVRDYFEPEDIPSVVKVVVDATRAGRSVRVVGSLWSMEDIAYSSEVGISLARLADPNPRILAEALTPEWRDLQGQVEGDKVAHLAAGLTIHDVAVALEAKNLAMKTLGGANGQTLGGALATGTHGGDWDMPPLADMVTAIHLVDATGRQVWIERASEPLTNHWILQGILESECADTMIVRNDTAFDAALVSMGRFGVVCSFVLRVTRAFSIAEWTTIQPWASVRALLATGLQTGTFLQPLFDALPAPPATLDANDVQQPTGLEIVINTVDPTNCFVKRRWGVSSQLPPIAASPGPDAICAIGTVPILAAINAVLDKAIASAAGGVILNPVGGAIALGVLIAAKVKFNADVAALPAPNLGDIISLCFNTLWDVGLGFLSDEIQKLVFNARYSDTLTTGKRGPAYLIKTGTLEANQQNCYRADSVEPAFTASDGRYLSYLDGVLRELPRYKQSGYISIRFCATTRALMGMHNFASRNAVSIETTSLRSLKENPSWMNFVELSCLEWGGRPHWGQMNDATKWLCYETMNEAIASLPPIPLPFLPYLTKEKAAGWALYGINLQEWRAALLAIDGGVQTFSTAFTQTRFLEPTGATLPLNLVEHDIPIAVLELLLA